MTNKIKILIMVGSPIGGIRRHVHDLISNLSQDVFDVYYIYSSLGADQLFAEELPVIKNCCMEVKSLPIVKRPSLRDCANIGSVVSFIIKNNIDIIHGHGAKGGLYARVASLLTRRKSVYTPHGGAVHRMFGRIEELIYSTIEKIVQRCTHCLIFESRYTQEAYARHTGGIRCQYEIIYNGVAKISPERKADCVNNIVCHEGIRNLGVFGLLRKEKGQHVAIAMMPLLLSEQKVHLHIFGTGPDRDALEKQAEEISVEENITFHGEVLDVVPYMQKMDLIVVPSLFESFGYVPVEARRLGIPCVATAVGGLLETVQHEVNGLLCKENSPCALKDSILLALQKEWPQTFSWEEFRLPTMVGKISTVYKRLLNKR